MPEVVGIRFKSCGKIYDFEANGSGEELKRGDRVVVESELGLSIGNVVIEKHIIENPAKELRKILRKATDEDLKQKTDNVAFEKEARDYCLERIMARGLPMKLVATEATLDKKRIIFYFTADGRIDFREIVKDLAAKFKTRIEMRQIGVRDEAKIVGGFGLCGRELCCKTFLTSFEPISIKMAKQQELVLNMSKLSGICGRLMCCLGYEILEEVKGAGAGAEVAVAEENSNIQEAIEVPLQPELVPELSQDMPQRPEITEPEPQISNLAQPQKPLDTAEGKTETAEHKHGQGHRKRKRWRWRKFHKQGKPENK